MHIKDVEKLKAWLLKRLSPLCDADPSALSKYIVALLRKEKPRSALKELCINQLEVFLAKETPSFVDRLFLSLDTESYLTGSKDSSPSSTTGSTLQAKTQPTNKTGNDVNIKGHNERGTSEQRRLTDDSRHREVDDDDRDFRRARSRHGSPLATNDIGPRKRRIEQVEPPKRSIRQRLGVKEDDHRNNRRPHPSRRRSKSRSRSRSRSSTPEYVNQEGEGGNMGRKISHTDQNKQHANTSKRQRCKDYDERGMCLLGEQCPFDHGVDPVVITGPIPPPYPPPPHFPPLGMPAPPTLPNTSNGGLILPPVIPPLPTVTSSDCYNPEEPSLNLPSKVLAPPPPPPSMHPSLIPLRPGFRSMPPPPPPSGLPSIPRPTVPPIVTNNVNMGGAPSGSSVPAPKTSSGKTPFRLSDTLVLRKIPKDLNTITKLSGHFEKFGTIVNLQVRYENDPESAIVQFTTPQEARKAHDSTEAVLNNRFIKVYYLKNTGQSPYTHGQKENFLKTSTPAEVAVQVIKPVGTSVNTTNTTETTPTATQAPPTQSTPSNPMLRSKQKQQMNDVNEPSVHMKKQLAKQEALHSAAQKRFELQKKSQSLLEAQIAQQKLLLNKLEKSGNMSTEEKSQVIETLKSLSSSITNQKQTLSSASKTAHVKPIHHAPPTTAPPIKQNTHQSDPSYTLQQTADNLRNEARQLGILPSHHSSDERGSDLRNKLESKPRQLLVINSIDDKELLIKYFESFGGLNQVEVDPNSHRNLIFTFRNRTIAEKAVQGSIFKGKPLIMKWYEPKPIAGGEDQQLQQEEKERDRDTNSRNTSALDDVKIQRTVSISNEIDVEGLLDSGEPLMDVLTPPNQSKPRAVHLLDDDEDEEDRSWRR